jgi:hypothetical protein
LIHSSIHQLINSSLLSPTTEKLDEAAQNDKSAKKAMGGYYTQIERWSTDRELLPPRSRCILQNLLELRKSKYGSDKQFFNKTCIQVEVPPAAAAAC